MSSLPLAGLKVLDLSNLMAGPTATMHLADFGASVIKVEKPGVGDDLRRWGHARDGIGYAFKTINRNKSLITLDLSLERGRQIARTLAVQCDVVVEGFRPGTMERWGLGYDELAADHPGLIMLRVSGFGQHGPYSRRRGFGTLGEAYSGYAQINGLESGRPRLPAFGLADTSSGIFGAFGIMVALYHRQQTGQGQCIDLALYEGLLSFLSLHVTEYQQAGIEVVGGRDSAVSPRNTYQTSDGVWFVLSGGTDSTFSAICRALGVPQLATDQRFCDNRGRIANHDLLDELLMDAAQCLTWNELEAKTDAEAAPIFPVFTQQMIADDPHMRARSNILIVDDPDLGETATTRPVPLLDHSPATIDHLAGPVGNATASILRELLGLSDAGIEELSRAKVV